MAEPWVTSVQSDVPTRAQQVAVPGFIISVLSVLTFNIFIAFRYYIHTSKIQGLIGDEFPPGGISAQDVHGVLRRVEEKRQSYYIAEVASFRLIKFCLSPNTREDDI
jgi:hypothetical protein